MKRLVLDHLVVETTRRCNLTCEHCLRGDAEMTDMDMSYVEMLFERVSDVRTITFTGGEPTLVPRILKRILRLANDYEVSIGNFYIATNAVVIPDSFLIACIEWYCYCDDNDVTQVVWSNDEYHCNEDKAVEKLKALSFASAKYSDDFRNRVINEGRGVKFGENRFADADMELDDDDPDDERVSGAVYLNCKGQIVDGCDWSYDSQDDHVVCPVEKLSYTVIKKYLAKRDK